MEKTIGIHIKFYFFTKPKNFNYDKFKIILNSQIILMNINLLS